MAFYKRVTSLSVLAAMCVAVACGDTVIVSGATPDAGVAPDASEQDFDASNGDTEAPSAVVDFPPPTSFTDAATVLMRGTAADDVEVAAVRVAGVDAQSDDGFATWTVEVPVNYGRQTLTVEAEGYSLLRQGTRLPQEEALQLRLEEAEHLEVTVLEQNP